jgi:hypothetical protein
LHARPSGHEPDEVLLFYPAKNRCPEKCSHLRLPLFTRTLALSQLSRQCWCRDRDSNAEAKRSQRLRYADSRHRGVVPAPRLELHLRLYRFAGGCLCYSATERNGVTGCICNTYNSRFTVGARSALGSATKLVAPVRLALTIPRAPVSKTGAYTFRHGAIDWRCGRDLPPRYQRLKGAAFVYLHPHQTGVRGEACTR